ncbi:hypothetical protein H072_11365 [Dactylellina haptotyla CBS 200.50]|uniref:Uncharacterized protein n=1 Tax=Dactylellina haptotyla (strain CBS 200.50) TaxID=1284197 RepID=S7ZX18_DACHA|nr:hypothetical protein H072_11365 [Dactylellina haptotyla CBS 200.50]
MMPPRLIVLLLLSAGTVFGRIDREQVVKQFNPIRYASSLTTPMQVGNGNFAFGADITGMQTFQPFNTMSSWAWHNRSLPTTPGQTRPEDFTGLDWLTHGRLVNYDMPNSAENDISTWMIQNPHKINLGRIGLSFNGMNISEADLKDKKQVLDLWTGTITSSFTLSGETVVVTTVGHPEQDIVSFGIASKLLGTGALSTFIDYPYADGKSKFEAPFVGIWNAVANHTSTITHNAKTKAIIQHTLDATTYFTSISWNNSAALSRVNQTSHRYILQPSSGNAQNFSFSVAFTPDVGPHDHVFSFNSVLSTSARWWASYWNAGAFIDLTGTNSGSATELQRRIILSQYGMAVNDAANGAIAQESGLTNNGWYGKFHLEMTMWHVSHWLSWSKTDIFARSMPSLYNKFLSTSIERARVQGYSGARWGKMSDPTGRSAPGEINALLIWQQPHVMWFAEQAYLASPTLETLQNWDEVIVQSAQFMASYAFWNSSTGRYDLGPPMYPVGENTPPNATVNPTFELAYWRFGLDIASRWMQRQGKEVPTEWTHVAENLAPLPVQNGTYVHYEGIVNMWTNTKYTSDHPALIAIYGLLPPQSGIPSFSLPILKATLAKVYQTYNLSQSYGWDFPLLAMTSARLGDPKNAIDLLLHPAFGFDDVGMPVGGTRVATPYWPQSGGLLMAVAAMAGGWYSGSENGMTLSTRWPVDWVVKAEGFAKSL